MGEEIAVEACKQGLLGKELILGTTLVDMYAKCGMLRKAQEVFEKLPLRDEVSWNVLMAGYAQLGESKRVLNLFRAMRLEGNMPDLVTFLVLLNACNHGGLVGVGRSCFEAISKEYGGVATTEHYNCMIDLFSRAGQFYETLRIFQEMPFQHDLVSWITLLSACTKWGYLEIGKKAFELVVELYRDNGAAYILMSNVFMDGEE